ncbi:MAG: tryptophan--tRNA ligase [candidate division Zixibacteria bacterium RBG_16_40_9]|nr:MAG: tryptophan--tRNA ligase [candidate division Zixibacteria bacterium RBG_16_40_9]
MGKPIVLSGMQPTGKLHLGNLEGALRNWVSLQNNYEMYLCIVDWHSLTSDFDHTEDLQERIFQMALDYLASGLDPDKCAIFVQSQVKEHAELFLLLSMIVPIPWLERVPSYKEKSVEFNLDSFGFLGYPLLQAADILLYKANFVPVGKDQLPHIELTREIARRFNNLYGNVFSEPEGLLTKFAVVPGIDGRKMSKSYNNDISMADSPEETEKKVLKMITDPQKIYKGDKGRPEICPVYSLHQIYNPKYQEIHKECSSGELGCVDCKKMLASLINSNLAPIKSKRKELEKNPGRVRQVLENGAKRARAKAGETMQDVKQAMKLL